MNSSKISFAIQIVLLAAVGYLFYAHFSNCSSSNKAPEVEVVVNPDKAYLQTKKIVYVDMDTLNAHFLLIKDMRKEMEIEKNKSENTLKAKYNALQNEAAKVQEESKYYTQTQLAEKQQEFGEKQQDIMRLEQELNEKLMTQEAEKYKKLQKVVLESLQEIKVKYNYDFVLGYQGGGGNLLYATDSLNITPEVIQYLNQKHPSASTPKATK